MESNNSQSNKIDKPQNNEALALCIIDIYLDSKPIKFKSQYNNKTKIEKPSPHPIILGCWN